MPRSEWARRSIAAAERRVVHRRNLGRAGRFEHADQARTPAGQGNERERAALGVEFGRCVVVRPGVGEIERQRRLRIASPLRGNAGGGAGQRPRAVGADHEPHARLAAGMFDGDASRIGFDRKRRRGDARQLQRGGSGFERRQQMAVLDVVTERVEPDFGGVEKTSGARNSRWVSSMMRSFLSGAAWGRQARQAPSVCRAVTEPASSAVVR